MTASADTTTTAGQAPTRAGPGSAAGSARERWRPLLLRPVLIAAGLVVLWLVVRGQPLDSVEARSLNRAEITTQLVEHIQLSVIATVLTILIAVPVGIALNRTTSRAATMLGLGLGNLGQAIPSIGLIALLALWIGVGATTVIIALVVYAALPVLRNTIVGLESVDPVLTEAARGMGLSRLTVLLRVELPLAVPVILAGIRTALVLTVSSATLATFVDGGGLGGGLVTGLGLDRPILSVTFGIIVAALALLADWLGLVAEEFLRPKGI